MSTGTADFSFSDHEGQLVAGKYRLVQPIGEGGMGTVWLAEQTEPVKRRVALKLIKANTESKATLTRFEAERQALAIMDHPHIAKVLDGGLHHGAPYFVMELVNGLPITKFCDEARLDVRERLEMYVQVCQAVQHAHQKGIVHRDLKPSNILVTKVDGRPCAKVIDFGVAKALAGKLTNETLQTQWGAIVGTLEYMSPEQAGFSAVDIDSRADIYSLGVVLYELLTGFLPFDGNKLRQAALDEMVRVIRESEAPRPSTKISSEDSSPSTAALRRSNPKSLATQLRGELDCIILKALEKDRNRRYETANGLARDIQRYLNNEPVEARPPSAGYRFQKFASRNKGLIAAGTLIFAALAFGLIAATFGLLRAKEQTAIANRALATESATAIRENQAKKEALTQKAKAEKSLIAETKAKAQIVKQLQQIKNGNQLLTDIFKDLDTASLSTRNETAFEMVANRLVAASTNLNAANLGDRDYAATVRLELATAIRGMGFPDKAIPIVQGARDDFNQAGPSGATSSMEATRQLARCYKDTGQSKLAMREFEENLPKLREAYGKTDKRVLEDMVELSAVAEMEGQSERARSLLAEAFALMQATLPPDDHLLTLTWMDIAALHFQDRQFDRAAEIFKSVMETLRKTRGELYQHTLTAKANLASTYLELHRMNEAQKLMEEVVEQNRKSLGNEHPEYLTSAANLAEIYSRQGNYVKAVDLSGELFQTQSKKLGAGHLSTLATGRLLGIQLLRKGDAQLADKHMTSLVAAAKASLPAMHPLLGELKVILGTTKMWIGDHENAESAFREGCEILAKSAGVDHPETLAGKMHFADCLQERGKYDEAIGVLNTVIQGRTVRFGADSPSVLESKAELANVTRRASRAPEAVKMLDEIVPKITQKMGKENILTIKARNYLALALMESGRIAEAREILEDIHRYWVEHDETALPSLLMMGNLSQALRSYDDARSLEIAKRAYTLLRDKRGSKDHHTLTAANNYAVTLGLLGRFGEAIVVDSECAAGMEATYGAEHENTLVVRANLGNHLFERQRLSEAIIQYRLAIEKLVDRFGPTHSKTATLVRRLIVALGKSGQKEEALEEAKRQLVQYTQKLSPAEVREFRNRVCLALVGAGLQQEAVDLLEAAAKKSIEKPDHDVQEACELRIALAALCLKVDQVDRASKLFSELELECKKAFGEQARQVIFVGLQQGACLVRKKEVESAEKKFDAVLQLAEGSPHESKEELASAYQFAGDSFALADKSSLAEKYFRGCLQIQNRLLESKGAKMSKWQVAMVQSKLGNVLSRQGKSVDAVPLLAAGYAGLLDDERNIPATSKFILYEAAQRLRDHFEKLAVREQSDKFKTEMARWVHFRLEE